jgi:PKD repeat protein
MTNDPNQQQSRRHSRRRSLPIGLVAALLACATVVGKAQNGNRAATPAAPPKLIVGLRISPPRASAREWIFTALPNIVPPRVSYGFLFDNETEPVEWRKDTQYARNFEIPGEHWVHVEVALVLRSKVEVIYASSERKRFTVEPATTIAPTTTIEPAPVEPVTSVAPTTTIEPKMEKSVPAIEPTTTIRPEPTISLKAYPPRVLVGQPVKFRVAISNAGRQPNYVFSADGRVRQTEHGPTVTYTYQKAGQYSASVTLNGVNSRPGDKAEVLVEDFKLTLHPRPAPPPPAMTFGFYVIGLPKDFPYLQCRFHYGDGQDSEWLADTNVSHTYADFGTYRAFVEVGYQSGKEVTSLKASNPAIIDIRPPTLQQRLMDLWHGLPGWLRGMVYVAGIVAAGLGLARLVPPPSPTRPPVSFSPVLDPKPGFRPVGKTPGITFSIHLKAGRERSQAAIRKKATRLIQTRRKLP